MKILANGDLNDKEIIGYTWDTTALKRALKYFLEDAVKHKVIVNQSDFIGEFLQAVGEEYVVLGEYADAEAETEEGEGGDGNVEMRTEA